MAIMIIMIEHELLSCKYSQRYIVVGTPGKDIIGVRIRCHLTGGSSSFCNVSISLQTIGYQDDRSAASHICPIITYSSSRPASQQPSRTQIQAVRTPLSSNTRKSPKTEAAESAILELHQWDKYGSHYN